MNQRPGPEALGRIVKAYDVRGLADIELSVDVARALGTAFAEHTADDPGGRAAAIAVARDMRPSSPALAQAFAAGITAAGRDVIDIGLASTDLAYYASGSLGLPAAMFTASHNPAAYNGIKFCRAGAAPLSLDDGLAALRDRAADLLRDPPPEPSRRRGTVTRRDLLADYARHLRSLVDIAAIRPLTVVVDAGNGMAGLTVPAVLADSPVTVTGLYFDLDGTFPNHPANPLEPENLVDLQRAVRTAGADLGLAFDGDADRCFVVDERGEPVSPSAITALVALRELCRRPGATILHNLITSRAVPEFVAEAGGIPVRTRVGHSYIKQAMATTGAIFGGEHSAHYYFADFYRADTGMLAALHVLAAVGGQQEPLSRLAARFDRYAQSGEINSTVDDVDAALRRVRDWAAAAGAAIDELDGVSVDRGDGWFNVRASNTEPLLRLNVEAADHTTMARLRDEILALIRR